MSRTILPDTGYWIALFDPRDASHKLVSGTAELFDDAALVVPWPTLYETLRTRFVRRREWVNRMDHRLKRANVTFIDDQRYCEDAYTLTVEYATRLKRPVSMVDMLCRLIVADPSVRVEAVLTTNPSDFRDVCHEKGIELLP